MQVELIMSSLKCCFDAGTKCQVVHKTGHTVIRQADNVVGIQPVNCCQRDASVAP